MFCVKLPNSLWRPLPLKKIQPALPTTIIASTEILRRSERLANFTQVKEPQKISVDPFEKPISIPPPKTFREAKLGPW